MVSIYYTPVRTRVAHAYNAIGRRAPHSTEQLIYDVFIKKKKKGEKTFDREEVRGEEISNEDIGGKKRYRGEREKVDWK